MNKNIFPNICEKERENGSIVPYDSNIFIILLFMVYKSREVGSSYKIKGYYCEFSYHYNIRDPLSILFLLFIITGE